MKIRPAIVLLIMICTSCSSSQKKVVPLSAEFALGKINIITKMQQAEAGNELTLISRYDLKKDKMGADLNNYFQYHLGDKIRVLIGNDTIKPSLSYYVPLIDEKQKEIDCKYLLQVSDLGKPKRIIIADSVLDLNKVDISFN